MAKQPKRKIEKNYDAHYTIAIKYQPQKCGIQLSFDQFTFFLKQFRYKYQYCANKDA